MLAFRELSQIGGIYLSIIALVVDFTLGGVNVQHELKHVGDEVGLVAVTEHVA